MPTTLEQAAEALETAAALLRRAAAEQSASGIPEPAPQVQPNGTLEERARRIHPQIGGKQLAMLQLLHAAGTAGISRGDIARTMDYDGPNAGLALKGLLNAGVVEVVDGSAWPRLWRLVAELRG